MTQHQEANSADTAEICVSVPVVDNPYSTFWYHDRPDRVYVYRYDAGLFTEILVNFLHVDTETSRLTWAHDWAQVWDLMQAGVCREVCYGPATYNDGAFFLV